MFASTILIIALLSAEPDSFEQRLQAINLQEAKLWEMYLDDKQSVRAELIDNAVYHWTNPTKGGGQYGSVFVWTHAGRPAVVASIFAHPSEGQRRLIHEMHALTAKPLQPHCRDDDPVTWQPTAGLTLAPLTGAEPPAASAARRMIQMRAMGREFGGHTVDWRKQRWELRLLPRPLYRYEKTEGEVIDGALLALVTDAGTDPEILLLLEATKDAWHYALLRFTDSTFHVKHGDQEVFAAERGTPAWAQTHNPDRTYHTFRKRALTAAELADLPTENQP